MEGRTGTEQGLRAREELRCLLRISRVLSQDESSIDEVLSEMVDVLVSELGPLGVVTARLEHDGREFVSGRSGEGPGVTVVFDSFRRPAGSVSVCFEVGSDLEDEANTEIRRLLDSIAGDVGRFLERRTALERLMESEERFRRLAENAQDMLYRMSLTEQKYEYISPAIERLCGYPPEDFYDDPKLFASLIHEDSREYFEREWRKLRAGDMEPFYEYSIVDRQGRVRWIHQRNTLIRDEEGRPCAIEGVVTDITDRRMAEAEARKSRRRFLALFESNIMGVVVLNNERMLYEANDAFLKMLGYEANELPLDWEEITPEEWRPLDEQYRHDLVSSGSVAPWEKELLRKDGARVPVLVGGACLDESKGESIFIVLDRIEQSMAEEGLRESVARFQRLTENANYVIFRLAMDEGRFEYINSVAVELFGRYPDEFYRSSSLTTEVIHPHYRELVEEYRRAVLAGDEQGGIEYEVLDVSGESRWVSERSLPVEDEHGEVVAIEGSLVDITRRRKLEESLRLGKVRYRALFDANIIGVITAGIDGTILEANDFFLELVGYSKESLPLRWDDMTPPEWLEVDRRALEQLRTEGRCLPFKKEYLRRDGSRVPVIIGAAMLEGSEDQTICFVFEGRDRAPVVGESD